MRPEAIYLLLLAYFLVTIVCRRIRNRNIAYIVIDILTIVLSYLAGGAYALVGDIDESVFYTKLTYAIIFLFFINMIYNVYALVKKDKRKGEN
ncbi:MAG: hypothetical protein Q4P30_03310 [Eubacteriales bacterium]|nr:hypothetical protein [Eubacteriales bacterium]